MDSLVQKDKKEELPVIDVPYTELREEPESRVFSLSNVLGSAAFFSMLAVPGFVEGENYIMAVILLALLAVCAKLSAKLDEKER